jgi:hypothetical protein
MHTIEERVALLTIIETYEEACQAVEEWGIVPLSSCIPEHPSLESLTRPEAWHTGLLDDPWLWRDRLPAEGVAAYGRFFAGKPLLVASDLFPLLRCLLTPDEDVEERYEAGLLARSTVHVYRLISEQAGIDVKTLRRLAGLQDRAAKNEFDHALIDLQESGDILISGVAGRLNEHGNKSGWSSACYTLSEHWMEEHNLTLLTLSRDEARARLFARLEPRWSANALRYLRGKLK